jgi:hypothetical protein
MSETAAETTDATTETAATEAPDLSAEVEKWKNLARKHEDRAKANQKAVSELETLRQSQMSDQEKALEQAKAAVRTETLREVGTHLVVAEFRAQAAGRLTAEQVGELVEDLDMSKYLTDTGQVDAERVAKKVDALAPKPTENAAPTWPDLGQGARDTQTPALNSDGLTRALMAKVGAPRK